MISAKRSFAILIIPAILAAFFAYLLWLDLQEDINIGAGVKEIAKIQSVEGQVKRRPGDRFRWFNVGRNRGVYPFDSIITGDTGKTVITFKDGGKIEISENSLITFEERGENKIALRLKSGRLDFKGSSPKKSKEHETSKPSDSGILLESQGRTIDVSEAKGALLVNEGLVSLNVEEGSAVFGEGENAQKVEGGKNIQVSEDGSTQLSDGDLELLLPKTGKMFPTPPKASRVEISFQWEQPEQLGSVQLEISNQFSFANVWQSIKVTKQKSAKLSLPAGVYYWRLKASRDSVSETRMFEVLDSNPIKILEPSNKASVITGDDGVEILFGWTGNARFENYLIQVSRDIDFGDVVEEEKTGSSTQAFIELEPASKLYWRVQARSSDEEVLAQTQPRVLQIKKKKIVAKKEPEDKIPFDVTVPPESGKFVLIAKAIGKGKQRIPFKWTCSKSEKSEAVVSIKNEDEKEVFQQEVSSPFAWTATAAGKYTWTLESDECFSSASFEVESIIEAIPQPEIRVAGKSRQDNRLGNTAKRNDVLDLQISWEPVKDAKSYQLLFSEDEEFKKVDLKREVKDTKEVVSKNDFPFTPVYYRVETITQDNQVVTSPIGKFSFKFLPPVQVHPKVGAHFSKAELKEKSFGQMIFSWEHTNFTEIYEIEISKDSKFTQILKRKKTKDNFIVEKAPVPGTYWWRVRSVGSSISSGPSKASSFIVSD